MNHTIRTLLLLLFLAHTSCVTVKLGNEVEKSRGLALTTPASPFQEVNFSGVDQSWKSQKTGNMISYFSECGGPPLSLDKVQQEGMRSLQNSELVQSTTITHDGREALSSLIHGKSEGISLFLSTLIYQKNGCRYTLTYSGQLNQYEQEASHFDKFKQEFKAP